MGVEKAKTPSLPHPLAFFMAKVAPMTVIGRIYFTPTSKNFLLESIVYVFKVSGTWQPVGWCRTLFNIKVKPFPCQIAEIGLGSGDGHLSVDILE
jgi:hypothetical protein